MPDHRKLLRTIFDTAVAAAHPDSVLGAHLPPVPKGRVICLAAGKSAAAMAAAAERHYLDALGLDPARLVGVATTRHGHGVPTRRIEVVEAGHPVPDEAGLRGADASLKLAGTATAGDLLLVVGLVCLFFEVLKSTNTGRNSVIEHMLSVVVFVIFLVEFLLVGAAASSVFFILMMMAIVDVVAGFTVSITGAGRDVTMGG